MKNDDIPKNSQALVNKALAHVQLIGLTVNQLIEVLSSLGSTEQAEELTITKEYLQHILDCCNNANTQCEILCKATKAVQNDLSTLRHITDIIVLFGGY